MTKPPPPSERPAPGSFDLPELSLQQILDAEIRRRKKDGWKVQERSGHRVVFVRTRARAFEAGWGVAAVVSSPVYLIGMAGEHIARKRHHRRAIVTVSPEGLISERVEKL